ncbi:vomeromodulin-like [Sus scrofa]|uniref:vomeromodulin-like n=1 Tax=Sus scrofa TaxID=9823 RepID=UPI000A2B0EDB|nr:vomeromodulin-like [Sus scrofa]
MIIHSSVGMSASPTGPSAPLGPGPCLGVRRQGKEERQLPNFSPSPRTIDAGQDIGHKMLTLWALAIMLAIQARASDIGTLPGNIFPRPGVHYVSIPSELHFNPPANGPLSRVSRRGSIPKGSPDRTAGAKCPPVAKYFLSSSKLDAYLNAILPQKIEKTLMCEEVNLAGVLGEAISTVSNSDLLSVLDITSLLSLSGGGGLGGILGKGTSSLGILGGGGLVGGLGGTLSKGTSSLGILGGGGLVGGLGGTLSKGTAPLGILGGGGLAGGLGGTLSKGTASLGILGGGGLAGGLSGGLGGGLGGILGKGTASLVT